MKGLPIRHLNWLVCDSATHSFLLPTWQKFMGRTPFKPHLTLVGKLHASTTLEESHVATVTDISVGAHPYQCLVLNLKYKNPLESFLNKNELYAPYFPHVSLAYYLPQHKTRAAKARLAWMIGREIVFDALWQVPVTPSMKHWRPLYGP